MVLAAERQKSRDGTGDGCSLVVVKNAIDAREVLQKIVLLADGAEAAALLCFESPNDPMQWCHRGQVAGWLHDKLKIEVREYSLEGCGCGWSHPKLFAKLRK